MHSLVIRVLVGASEVIDVDVDSVFNSSINTIVYYSLAVYNNNCDYNTKSSVCPYGCLSLCTLTYHEHIGWNTSKIISWPDSLMYVLRLISISAQREIPKIGWNGVGQ